MKRVTRRPLRLIREDVGDFSQFTIVREQDEETGSSTIRFTGPFVRSDVRNKNRRLYSEDVLVPAVDEYIKERIDTRRALGELGHPEGVEINLDRVSHIVDQITWEGPVGMGSATVFNETPMGTIARTLIENEVRLGVSSRGLGDLKEVDDGFDVENFHLIAVDLVADPSTPEAFVDGVREDRQYVIEASGNIVAVERAYSELDHRLSRLPKRDKIRVVTEALKDFLRKL